MTSPRPYGGGYHSSPSFPDTPIYDSLVAERGTPQIAPIRVPAAYEPIGGYSHAGAQPALPAALPALPAGPSQPQQTGYSGYQTGPARQPAPAPTPQAAPYFPQQAAAPRPYPAAQAPQAPAPQQMRPAAPRPAAPRQAPGGYQNPYPAQQQQQQHPNPGYWAEQGPGR
jgi:uncharacterized protein DUF6643